MPLLATTDLTKRYPNGVTALDQLTLSIEPGIIGLVGSNGAGKSTLLKIILGLLPPTSGSLTVLDRNAAHDGPALRQYLGYIPEFDCLPPDQTAADLVTHLGRVSGLPAVAARERAAEMLRHVGLYDERYRPIGGYSTGMKQRVKLAQALVHDPQLLLLDEPTNGLDPEGRNDMLDLIRRTGREFGISVIVASHLLGEIEQVCTFLVAIDGGRLLRAAPMSDFTRETEQLVIDVVGDSDRFREALVSQGMAATAGAGGSVVISIRDGAPVDAVRDTAAALGVGLLRMARRRNRLEDLFESATAPGVTDAA
ncbi:MAG TPA: ABC transporter ATP-binding protein [Gemmatimonadales bacterium]|jgi:ABC-2 type transport system ATP-binding protein